jgi:hypothetical protein
MDYEMKKGRNFKGGGDRQVRKNKGPTNDNNGFPPSGCTERNGTMTTSTPSLSLSIFSFILFF